MQGSCTGIWGGRKKNPQGLENSYETWKLNLATYRINWISESWRRCSQVWAGGVKVEEAHRQTNRRTNKHTHHKDKERVGDGQIKGDAAGWTGGIHNLLSSIDVTTGDKWSREHKRALFITRIKVVPAAGEGERAGYSSSHTTVHNWTQI